MRRFFILAIPLFIAGCQTISNWADSAGSNMPTVGERCYHWQCFTSGGQRESDKNKAIETMAKTPPKPNNPQPAPANTQTAPVPTK